MNAAVYNEIDPYAARWLRNLIDAGHVAPGVVYERSIRALLARDVGGPGQRHFFAGIGTWSGALRDAGWPDDLDAWTGSCPCQPFSSAGARTGTDDDRHLWPDWFKLIAECRPPIVFGEQVASQDGLAWLDAVSSDLEGAGYAFGAADLCAAGVGAPHLRQRLWFVGIDTGAVGRLRAALRAVADDDDDGRIGIGEARLHDQGPRGDNAPRRRAAGVLADGEGERRGAWRIDRSYGRAPLEPDGHGTTRIMADSESIGRRQGDALGSRSGDRAPSPDRRPRSADDSETLHMGDSGGARLEGRGARGAGEHHGATRGFWADAEWIPCRDGVFRPVEPGTFPLAHGADSRVGRLRAYGNGIVRPVAAIFVRSVIDAIMMVDVIQ